MRKSTKEIVADRLDGLMKAIPRLGTQQKLAQKTGLGQTTIGRIRRGEVNATADNLRAIADAFGVDVGYLYGETNEYGVPMADLARTQKELMEEHDQWNAFADETNAELVRTRGKLPLISDVQAGEWSDIVDHFQPGDAEDWLPCPFRHGPNAFILRVAGHSMHNPSGELSFAPGEFIAVDPQVEPLNKKLVVAKVDGEERATFKQLIIEPDGTHLLQALNPSWPNRIMHLPRGSRIVGVVIGKWTVL